MNNTNISQIAWRNLLRHRRNSITLSRYHQIIRDSGKIPAMGDPVLLSMYGKGGFKIREVPLTGVFSFSLGNPQLDEMVLSDMQTIRALNSLSQNTRPG